MKTIFKIRAGIDFSCIFHSANAGALARPTRDIVRTGAKIASAEKAVRAPAHACTILRHPPVDGPHSAENKGDAGTHFPLTQKSKGVKPHSFFDMFLSFPGWRCVRGSS